MKNIHSAFAFKHFIVFVLLVIIITSVGYLFAISVSKEDLRFVFLFIALSIVILGFFLYIYLKKENEKIKEDINSLLIYISEISNKNYNSSILIKYYSELLEISLRLKNIVKRLKKKD